MFNKSNLIKLAVAVVVTAVVLRKANEAKAKDPNGLLAKLAIS